MGRTLRVDHVSKYKTPTKGEDEETDEELEELKKKAFPLQYEALDGLFIILFIILFIFFL